jgi:hypothetical protein
MSIVTLLPTIILIVLLFAITMLIALYFDLCRAKSGGLYPGQKGTKIVPDPGAYFSHWQTG